LATATEANWSELSEFGLKEIRITNAFGQQHTRLISSASNPVKAAPKSEHRAHWKREKPGATPGFSLYPQNSPPESVFAR